MYIVGFNYNFLTVMLVYWFTYVLQITFVRKYTLWINRTLSLVLHTNYAVLFITLNLQCLRTVNFLFVDNSSNNNNNINNNKNNNNKKKKKNNQQWENDKTAEPEAKTYYVFR